MGNPNKMIVIDVETTGVIPTKHSILSIGAIDFNNPENQFYERDFIATSVKRENITWIVPYRTIDLHTVAYTYHLKKGLLPPLKEKRTAINLDYILTLVGLPEEPKPHNALTGAKMEAEAFSRLLQKKILLKEFEKYPIPEHLED